jgi:hypothetical protein
MRNVDHGTIRVMTYTLKRLREVTDEELIERHDAGPGCPPSAGSGQSSPCGGCQNVAELVPPSGEWAHSPVAGALDTTTQDDPGHATTVFRTVVSLEESGIA